MMAEAKDHLQTNFMYLIKTLFLILLTPFFMGFSIAEDSSCDRENLKGLYMYLALPITYIYRMDDKVMEKLGDIVVNIEYDSTLTRVEPIKASPINIETKSPSLSIPKKSSTGSGQSGKGNRRARRKALKASRKKL